MNVFKTLSLTLLFAALVAAPSSAQDTAAARAGDILTSGALDAVVTGHESAVDRQRAELTDLLSGDRVRGVADDRGIDLGQVESAAAGLTDAQVRTVSPLVAAVNAAQERGGLGSVTISVVALILILLILILVT